MNIDEVCVKIDNCNSLFIEKGNEGMRDVYKNIIKRKKTPQLLEEFRPYYDLNFIDCIRRSKNPIQVEKTDQEQTLKITYKIDL